MSSDRSLDRTPALGLVSVGAISVQFGAALATKLFHRVGPSGAVALRLVIAAVVLAGLAMIRDPRRSFAGIRSRDTHIAVLFGLALAAMNLSFYEAIDRIPLGVAVTIEFSGPLALALVGSRRLTDAAWAILAGAGVALLASGAGKGLDPAGLGLAGVAGAGWIAYILLSKETGRRFDALPGLTIAMLAAAIVVLPAGIASGGARLFDPGVLALGSLLAVLSSVVPYSLELVALRQVTSRAFGVMLSLDPAVATAAGLAILGQHLTDREWVALALVVAANFGNSVAGSPGVVTTTP